MPFTPSYRSRPKELSAKQRFLNTVAEAAGAAVVSVPVQILEGVVKTGGEQLFGKGGKMRDMFMSPEQVRAEDALRALEVQKERTNIDATLAQIGLTNSSTEGNQAQTRFTDVQAKEFGPTAQVDRATKTTNAIAQTNYNNRMAGVAEGNLAVQTGDLNLRARQAEWEMKLKEAKARSGGPGRPKGLDSERIMKLNKEAVGLVTGLRGIVEQRAASMYGVGTPQYEALVGSVSGGLPELMAAPDDVKRIVFGWSPAHANALNFIFQEYGKEIDALKASGEQRFYYDSKGNKVLLEPVMAVQGGFQDNNNLRTTDPQKDKFGVTFTPAQGGTSYQPSQEAKEGQEQQSKLRQLESHRAWVEARDEAKAIREAAAKEQAGAKRDALEVLATEADEVKFKLAGLSKQEEGLTMFDVATPKALALEKAIAEERKKMSNINTRKVRLLQGTK